MIKQLLFFIFPFIFTFHLVEAQQIRLNEIMASNRNTVSDENNDYEDWIELYNSGEEEVDLAGYGLSDNYNQPFKWTFPGVTLQPGDYLVIWASGKDRTNPARNLHTNFNIDKDGEEIILTHPDGQLIDEFSPRMIPTGISAGRNPDGTGQWFYFNEPTPGQANSKTSYNGLLGPPVFNKSPGFYENPVFLSITHDDPDVTIRYTTDGSVPDHESDEYSDLLELKNRSGGPNEISMIRTNPIETEPGGYGWEAPLNKVAKANVIRATAFKDNYLPYEVASGTWFIGNEFTGRYKLNVVSLITSPHNFFDHEYGIYIPGKIYEDRGYGTGSWGFPNANYFRRGANWERPVHFEYFDKNSKILFAHGNLGVRIHGGGSRAVAQKSLRLYDRGDGMGNRLQHPFFRERPYSSFKRLILRNSGQDWYIGWKHHQTMLKDAFLQQLVKHMNFEYQAYTPAITFLNGEFWGLHNIRERIDKYFIEQLYGVDPGKLDLLTYNANTIEGGRTHYVSMLAFMDENDLSEPENYEYIKTQMDVDCYIDYVIANTFVVNDDWPGNNVDYWRKQTDFVPVTSSGHDGRWRWVLYDLDFGATRNAEYKDMFKMLKYPGDGWPNPAWSVKLINHLWKSDEFVARFCTQYANHLNTTFLTERSTALLTSMEETIEHVMVEHFERWGRTTTIEEWKDNVDIIREFLTHRPWYVRKHLLEYFDLGTTVELTVNNPTPDWGTIKVNNMILDEEFTPGVIGRPVLWKGIYFSKLPVTLEVSALPGYNFSHWEGVVNSTSEKINLNLEQNSEITAVFKSNPGFSVIHYWHFNKLPFEPVNSINADYSTLGGAIISYPGTGVGYMDRINGTNLNAESGYHGGFGLRVRNPADTRELVIKAPSTGFKDLTLSFAVHRTNNGNMYQQLFYSPDKGKNWKKISEYGIELQYELKSFDLSSVKEINNNPNLQFKITFPCDNSSNESGNNRFDNIVLSGNDLDANNEEKEELPFNYELSQNYPNPFSHNTIIPFTMEDHMHVLLEVFNIMGEKVVTLVNEYKQPGKHEVVFDGSTLTPGIYYYRMTTRGLNRVKQMIVVR